MNQRQSCLSDYSRNFAEFWPLANGSRPIYAPVVFFCHADFADDADFSSWDYFVPQISQIYTDFFHRKVFSSDFTDESEGILAYRITHGISQNFGRWPMARALYMLLLFFVTQISQMTQIFLRGMVLSHRFHRYTQIFYGISGESLCPIPGGICNDRTGRLCEIPCHPMKKSASSAKSA